MALLVHGFPGTPAEMHPLGEVLNKAGWSVEGILLPGFGPQIVSIGSCRYQDWLKTIQERLAIAKREYASVVLIGYSMGAALAIAVAAQDVPHGLVLLAPFGRLNAGWRGMLLPILKWVFPHFRPFDKADFSNPDVRESIYSFAPTIDLDDRTVQASIRRLSIPSRVIDELRKTGRLAFRSASQVTAPVLIVQGSQDPLAKASHARDLSRQFAGSVQYHEIQAGHELLRAENDTWDEITRLILDFSDSVANK